MKPAIGRPSEIKISIDDAMLDKSMTFESYYFAKSYPILNVMWVYYPKQSIDSVQSLSSYQYYLVEEILSQLFNQKKEFHNLYGNTKNLE